MSTTLAHSLITAKDTTPQRWLLGLHGILGSRANWRTIARKLVAERPTWGMALLDLRRHGDSQSVEGEDTVPQAAVDVWATARALDLPVGGVLGHSFGGKVALEAFSREPEALDRVFVIDAMPGACRPEDSAVGSENVLTILERSPTAYASRKHFIEAMEGEGLSTPLAHWLAMNLERTPVGVQMKLSYRFVRALLEDYFRRDYWSIVEQAPGHAELHLVVGGRSVAYDEAQRARAEAASRAEPRVRVTTIPDAGHWIHADQPEALLNVLAAALPA